MSDVIINVQNTQIISVIEETSDEILVNVDSQPELEVIVQAAVGGGSSGPADWNTLQNKPLTFPPEDHNHNSLYEQKNSNIQAHISSIGNPHGLNKSDIGLGNVDNTSDVDKPISNATQTALNGKQNVLGFTPEDSSEKGQVNGYASLDSNGKVPSTQLPILAKEGNTIIDFGSFPGNNTASITISGQTDIAGTDEPIAEIVYDSYGSYSLEEIAFLSSLIKITCGRAVAGNGFTINAFSLEKIQGQIPVRWKY